MHDPSLIFQTNLKNAILNYGIIFLRKCTPSVILIDVYATVHAHYSCIINNVPELKINQN